MYDDILCTQHILYQTKLSLNSEHNMHISYETALIILKRRSGVVCCSLNAALPPKMKPLIRTMYEKRKSGGGVGQWKTGGG